MTKFTTKSRPNSPIAQQWDCNAESRFKELNAGQDRTYTDILCPVLYKLLKNASPGNLVIDAGCGLGFFSNYIEQLGFNVTGVDMSSRSISIAQNSFPSINFHNEDIVKFSEGKNGLFDAGVVNMLFHNVPNVEKVAAAIFRLLKQNGVMIGCIPHPTYWFDRRRSLAKRIYIDSKSAYLTPFKIKGSVAHPAPFTYFHRKCENYLRAFIRAGFSEARTVSFEGKKDIPEDLIFFIAKRK